MIRIRVSAEMARYFDDILMIYKKIHAQAQASGHHLTPPNPPPTQSTGSWWPLRLHQLVVSAPAPVILMPPEIGFLFAKDWSLATASLTPKY